MKDKVELIGTQALGMIETRGLVASIEAADAMMKAANVTLLEKKSIGAGYITIMIRGDVGAVKTALSAGRESASRVGDVISSRIIPGPHFEIEELLPGIIASEAGE